MSLASIARGLTTETSNGTRRTIPFDYTFRLPLAGQPGAVRNRTVQVSVEADFVALSIGYGAVPELTRITFGGAPDERLDDYGGYAIPEDGPVRNITFQKILEDLLTTRFRDDPEVVVRILRGGFRINPEVAEVALQGVTDLRNAPELDRSVLSRLFESVGAPPQDVQFLYALFDEGTGRAFQSEPLLSTAGLGAADGRRPFRYFAQPIVFSRRATIRLEVTEVSTFLGELHVVLHGYKMLGGQGTPTDAQATPSRLQRGRGGGGPKRRR